MSFLKTVKIPPWIRWLMPRVPLVQGRPTGETGKSFKVRNYLTIGLEATHIRAPVAFHKATLFIFTDKDQLLLARDFDINIVSVVAPASSAAGHAPASTEKEKPTAKAITENQIEPAQQDNSAAGLPIDNSAVDPPAGSGEITDPAPPVDEHPNQQPKEINIEGR